MTEKRKDFKSNDRKNAKISTLMIEKTQKISTLMIEKTQKFQL